MRPRYVADFRSPAHPRAHSRRRSRSQLAVVLLLALACSEPSAPERSPAASVRVSPTGLVLEPGDTEQLTAVVRDTAGNVLPGRAIAWTMDNPVVATVDPTGLVTAVAPGYATIVATSEGKTFGVGVTVVARPSRASVSALRSSPARVKPRRTGLLPIDGRGPPG